VWPSGIRWNDTSGRCSRCTKRFARRPDDEGDAPCASGGRFVIRSPMSSPGRIGSGARLVFGTSGWRAVIADQFTFANVRLVARAIADYLADQGLQGGRDRRLRHPVSSDASRARPPRSLRNVGGPSYSPSGSADPGRLPRHSRRRPPAGSISPRATILPSTTASSSLRRGAACVAGDDAVDRGAHRCAGR
jgi:hypothetical protein